MKFKRSAYAFAAALTLAFSAVSYAQTGQPQQMGKAEGEVRKIDKETKKITLRHGPIEGMDMPGMTMVFQVADPALLDKAGVGDKVRFTVTSGGGAMTLQSLEKAQ